MRQSNAAFLTPAPREIGEHVRVTEVLAPWQDFGLASKADLEAAAKRGTTIHGYCEELLKTGSAPLAPAELVGVLAKFARWRHSVISEVVASELRLFHDDLLFTGQIDILARFRGDKALSVIDIKTPKNNSPIWRPQLAAYKFLALANGYEVDRTVSLRLGTVRPLVSESTATYQYDLAGFLSALNAHKYFKSIKVNS